MKVHLFNWKYAALIVGLAVLAMLVMDFNSRMAELRRLTNEYEQVQAVATQKAETKAALEREIAYATSDAAVIEWAYQDGHMVRPGDVPVVPLAPGGPRPTPTPTPLPTPEPLSNPESWFALFFGQD
jgi:cell division protein FtsB